MKTFKVPVVHVCEFGLEVEVQAETAAEAKRLALAGKEIEDGNGYDWSRFELKRIRLGHWQQIEETT